MATTESAQNATLVMINPIGNDDGCWQFLGPMGGQPFLYPGHGSRKRVPGWTDQQVADEVVAKFQGPLDIVGMSFGASIVAHILTRHPGRVRSAVIACSGSVVRRETNPDQQSAARKMYVERGALALRSGMAAVVDATFPRWFTPLARRTEHPGVAYARRTLLAMDPEAWNDVWLARANAEAVTPEALAAVRTPVTIIAGTHDQAAGLAGLAEAHRLIPNSRLEIVAGPHMLHLEEPLSLVSALGRHFAWAPIGNRVEMPLGTLAS